MAPTRRFPRVNPLTSAEAPWPNDCAWLPRFPSRWTDWTSISVSFRRVFCRVAGKTRKIYQGMIPIHSPKYNIYIYTYCKQNMDIYIYKINYTHMYTFWEIQLYPCWHESLYKVSFPFSLLIQQIDIEIVNKFHLNRLWL